MNPHKKILIFDLDGTLLDSLADIQWALNTTLVEFGFKAYDRDRVGQMVGHCLTELVRQAVPDGHRADEQVKPLVLRIKALYTSVPFRDTVAYPGLVELMRELKAAGHVMAVLTNKAEPIAQLIVPHFFSGVFDVIQGEKPGLPRKPDPESLLGLLRTLAPLAGMDTSKIDELKACAVMIGDSEADIHTAALAGVAAIGVGWGYRSTGDLIGAGASQVARDSAELASWLRG